MSSNPGVGDDVPHELESALDDEVVDELGLVEDLEVGHLRRVSRVGQGLESLPDQCGESSAEDGLLAEEVGVGLVVEGGLEDAGAGGSESLREGQRDLLRVSGDVLVDADEGGDSESLGEDEPLHVSGGLGGHHDDVDVRGGCR